MLWVMGDHRAVSDDSRRHLTSPGGGAVEESQVVGKAVAVIWPHGHWRTLGTPATFAGVPAVAMLTLPWWPARTAAAGAAATYPERHHVRPDACRSAGPRGRR